MNSENLPKVENEPYNPNLDAQDEDVVSGGNNKLTYILVGVILALILVYVALPKGGGTGLASVTPSFMLDDAAVTATAPTSADSIAAGLKAAPAAAEEATAKTTTKTVVKPTTTAATTAAPAAAPAVAAAAPAPVEAAPAPAPVAAPEPAAPTTVTMSGKIEDENGRPLVGATVLLKGSSKGTSTDANGNYTLEVPSGDNTLIYGYGGYDDEEVRNSGSKPVNVTLTPRAKASRKRR
ncbi:carboxypeptidase-like regulatory domain-containing protein [Microvirga sp. STS02]|uniref:carboxypeptidase-like regulatory domain-containing protein n=1 Tax=Hymenobacter negativus TaxID=2795026 RepID=UPI0018DD0AEF|nr:MULTISPECIES: carboxypeptidase-like regulatory domain-containing protein [Bacteria]MBH8569125.1 carboxypeptidase-like regulatory domain-containing protein [Hymenobacter negativus]MBR7208860.1 carboxypeptidase-like regulatory domain-containing protein [Microvirga sp. STS02]